MLAKLRTFTKHDPRLVVFEDKHIVSELDGPNGRNTAIGGDIQAWNFSLHKCFASTRSCLQNP